MQKPSVKPKVPYFSSGPCAKRPGWTPEVLKDALLGRSHRSKEGRARIQEAMKLSREILGLPEDYLIAIVPASDTGAVEMVLWSMLGARGVDVFGWEVFGNVWVTDIVKHLKIKDARSFQADFGQLPDIKQANFDNDVVFTWNGTTSGVKIPNGDWIAGDRKGLTICDATSAIFAMEMPWDKLDVVTYSWQKVLGGEAAHGVLILSPRAVERLESYVPAWPLPKIFRMTKGGKLDKAIFEGDTINTPSMLCVEDVIDSLKWMKSIGGRAAVQKRVAANFKVISDWVAKTEWAGFLAEDPAIRSETSVCLKITDPAFAALDVDGQWDLIGKMTSLLDKEGVGFDIKAHRDAAPGLRIWCGATVETADVQALMPWVEWAYGQTVVK